MDNEGNTLTTQPNNEKLFIMQPKPDYSLAFYGEDAKEIGRLSWNDGILVFEGVADDSAKVLFDFLKPLVNAYIQEQLKE